MAEMQHRLPSDGPLQSTSVHYGPSNFVFHLIPFNKARPVLMDVDPLFGKSMEKNHRSVHNGVIICLTCGRFIASALAFPGPDRKLSHIPY